MAPRSAAANVGRNPAAPVMAPITHCAGRCAASTTAASPAAASMPVPDKRILELAIGRRIADRGEARADLARQRGQGDSVGVRAHRLDPIAPGLALDQIDGARADRSGRAQQCHAALAARSRSARVSPPSSPSSGHHISKPRAGASIPPCARPIRQASTAAATKPSSRSIRPPWPGINAPGVLNAEPALDRGFDQIACLGGDRQRNRDQRPPPGCCRRR